MSFTANIDVLTAQKGLKQMSRELRNSADLDPGVIDGVYGQHTHAAASHWFSSEASLTGFRGVDGRVSILHIAAPDAIGMLVTADLQELRSFARRYTGPTSVTIPTSTPLPVIPNPLPAIPVPNPVPLAPPPPIPGTATDVAAALARITSGAAAASRGAPPGGTPATSSTWPYVIGGIAVLGVAGLGIWLLQRRRR